FADPQRLNPGNISIIRSIVRGAPAVDTAVFTGPRADYAVTLNGNGTVTVVHTAGAGFGTGNDGTDTLRNIELLQFSDGTIVAPGADVRVVPNVVGMTQAAATTAITGAGLTVGAVTTAFSDTMPAGRVISSTPAAGSVELPGAPVALVISRGPNDVTPPTVSIASPAAGATVSGTVDVTATAADNVGVGGVQFLLDGNLLGAEDTTAPYSVAWNTTTAANGTHTLAAHARDASGNVATSAAVTVTVFNDLIAPTVSIASPAAGATVSGTVDVRATAADNVGVGGVQFLLDDVADRTGDTSAPCSVAWNTTTAANGTHTLAARARDASGNVATSAAVTVTVFNDLMAPTVSIASPAAGATVSGTVDVRATAADNVGVVGVQFLLDNV